MGIGFSLDAGALVGVGAALVAGFELG